MNLNSNDSDRGSLCKDNSAPVRQQSTLLPFGNMNPSADAKSMMATESSTLKSEIEYPTAFGGFGMTPYPAVGGLSQEVDDLYNPSYSLNYTDYTANHSGNGLGPFRASPKDEKKLYSRHSLGSVFGYGENTMEPYGSRNDLLLPNLPDVMENEGLSPATQPLSGVSGGMNSMGSVNGGMNTMGGVNTTMNSTMGGVNTTMTPPMSGVMGSSSSLFNLGDSMNSSFSSVNHAMRGKELSPSFSASLSRGLNASTNSFMLSSFDTNDYSHFGGASLTPSTRTSGFAMNPLYLDNSGLMNDYTSEPGYSPVPSSPYYAEDMSPRRLFPSQSTNSRLLMTADAPPLQRSLSSMGNASLKPLNNAMDLPSSTIEYRNSSYKPKERAKNLSWQTGDVESFRGHIKDMSRDHNGCRTLQQCLDECPLKIVPMIYDEVGNELTDLMMDSFGNYLFQKLLDVSSDDQRREVLMKVKGKIVEASYNVHGTRSVQRLIQVCKEPDMVKMIMDALRGHIAVLSSDSNGNHVIQRCLQYMPEQYRIDVFREVVNSCVDISTHRHGCCVVQRCLDSAPAEYHSLLLDAIVKNSYELICNPFGNYVIQYLIEHGKTEEADRITRCVLGRVSELSCQKYSSNVIEKILSCATTNVRGEIIVEIANSAKLRELLHDKYANYVIQKALKIGTTEQKKLLLDAIRPYEEELGRSTGGKHILTQLNEITSTATSPRWNKD